MSEPRTSERKRWSGARKAWVAASALALFVAAVVTTVAAWPGALEAIGLGGPQKVVVEGQSSHLPLGAAQQSAAEYTAGWGPKRATYTDEMPASVATLNSITDNPDVGDERNFVRIRPDGSSEDYGKSVHSKNGDVIDVEVIIENAAADNIPPSRSTVRDFTAQVYLYTTGLRQVVEIELSGSNVRSVWDGATVLTDGNSRLEVVADSAHLITAATNNSGMRVPTEAMIAGEPFPLGVDSLDGTLPVGLSKRHLEQGFEWLLFKLEVVPD